MGSKSLSEDQENTHIYLRYSRNMSYMHHERDGLHLYGCGGLETRCLDVLNDSWVQIILLLQLFKSGNRIWNVSSVHVNPVLVPYSIHLKHKINIVRKPIRLFSPSLNLIHVDAF